MEPPTHTLLIGVLSFNAPGRSQRRDMIRRLSSPNPAAALLFVLPAEQRSGGATPARLLLVQDELRVLIPDAVDVRVSGKLILQNGFFRHAVQLSPQFHFVGRACAGLPAC